jgi:phosphopantetheine adenylyltransferase
MKNFRQLINELPSRKIVFTFGRFQPPTVGHELLVKAVQRVAKSQKADHVIYTSRSQDKKKNPLDVKRKVYYLKRMFPQANIVGAGDTTRTFIEVAKELNKRYKQIVMVAGSDRVTEYNRILNEYNGKEFNFETIQVVSAGERDPDADDASGMSGTKMRELAKKGDFNTFKKGLPSTLTTTDARRLMNDIRVGIGMEELKEEVKFETDLLREMYHKGDIFLVGQIVESNGQKFEIVDRGANYLSVVDRKGNISKKWLSDVKMTKGAIKEKTNTSGNQISYKGYTTTNFDEVVVESFLKTIEQKKDPVATLNAIKATDTWLGIIKESTEINIADFYSNIKKSQEALNNIEELQHHINYIEERVVSSGIPTGELLEMKFMAGDKIKVARIIATTLGVPDVEKTSSPTQLVNAGLRLIRNKPMRPEYLDVIKKMLQTAKEAGIDYEESLVPTKAKEVKESFKQFLAKEATAEDNPEHEVATSDTKMDKKGRKIPAHKIVFNPNEAEYQKRDVKESAPVAPSIGVHRIAVTVSEPDHPTVSKRKETEQKFVRVTTSSKERAVEQGKKHFKKKGFKVHDAHHVSMVYEEVELDEISSKLAGNYYGAATKKHIAKVGVKPNMYGRIEKDMGKQRKAGVDRAMDRITGARKTNEDVNIDEAHKIGDKVKIHKGPSDVVGKTGQVGEIRTAAGGNKTYTIDHEGGSIQLKSTHFKKMKEELDLSEDIKKEYESLKKHDIKHLRDMIKTQHKIVDTSEFKTKEHAISHYLRSKHGNKRVADAFGLKEETDFEYVLQVLDEALTSIDKGEYDYEGAMARTQLQTVIRNSQELINMLSMDENMPEWVQSKITLAQDYISSVRDYLKSREELGEEVTPSTGGLKKACWKGYTAVGMKTKNGRKVPNCVPVKEAGAAGAGEQKRTVKSMFPENYTIAKDIMSFKDLKRSSKMNKGIQEVETKVLDPESEKPKLGHESKPEGDIGHVDVSREASDVKQSDNRQAHTQSGHTFTGDESLRRRKAYHKMHEEVQETSINGKLDDLEDEDFEDDIEKIQDPEHIMHLYDDEEFLEDDDVNDTEDADENEKDDDEEDDKEVNEAIGRIERIKRGIRFKRTSAKRERLKSIALKRMSSSGVIQKRARRHAVIMMKQRLARKPLDKLSTQEKERLENFIQKRKALINRLAQRIAPKIRQIEKDRLQKRKSK